MRFRCYERFINLSSVLSSGPVPDSPLEVGLGVSLDEGVDGAHTAVSLGGVVDWLGMVSGGRGRVSRNIPPHSSVNLMIWLGEGDTTRSSRSRSRSRGKAMDQTQAKHLVLEIVKP